MTSTDPPSTTPPRPPEFPRRPRWRRALRAIPTLAWRTTVKAWDDSIIGWAAQAAFWQALSFPPLLLGLIGSLGYIGDWFGPDTVTIISERIISGAERTLSPAVVHDLIQPTLDAVLGRGPIGLMSFSFLLSLWAGSSAMSCFVAAIAHAHGQHQVRNPVWQRIFALLLYIVFLLVGVLVLPLVALGPNYLREIVPDSWGPAIGDVIDIGYFPFVGVLLIVALSCLYRFALPNPLPWLRLLPGAVFAGVAFWFATSGLRAYLTALARVEYTYGALATPLAFLLFTFFLGFSVVLGAELNAAAHELWPARSTSPGVRGWVSSQAGELITDSLRIRAERLGNRHTLDPDATGRDASADETSTTRPRAAQPDTRKPRPAPPPSGSTTPIPRRLPAPPPRQLRRPENPDAGGWTR